MATNPKPRKLRRSFLVDDDVWHEAQRNAEKLDTTLSKVLRDALVDFNRKAARRAARAIHQP